MDLSQIQTNWFDAVVVCVAAAGIFRGRARGISEELFDLLKWLVWLVAGGLAYKPAGDLLVQYLPGGAALSYVVSYLLVGLIVRGIFDRIKTSMGERLARSEVFGASEYYLGMGAGAARFLCGLLVALALLNAAQMTPEELAAEAREQRKNFEDISFPTFGSIQHTIFTGSVSGQFVGRYLEHELIEVGPPGNPRANANLAHRNLRPSSSLAKRKP